ncbi:unnamed protein product (macronuclear) [Paramecium tetraurelia]|uniref:HMG box domain-containing protein n=1 Tax=Paramecium tetraurelia TaxID=5888 RepID=A0EHY1_PARTE|nr:uncharacterized protein GSPATT00027249001 [Paramecium tetraurelia]CAK94922.1 unnamed protein product [Paramecium tetraurelia]|eukprot:XP_001462295.1 hypothetical protein (macronuclear) [Paramecium tetraurelia strain d4-2]
MQNSKKKQIFCNQFELFKDKKFKQIPSLKLVKVEQPIHQEQIFNESSAEDIFEQMGNKETNQDKLIQANKESKVNKNDDWKSYYNSRLKEIKLERPELNHNQLTQLISEEWKMIKKQFKKAPQPSNQDEDVLNKKKIKQNKDKSKFCQEVIYEKQESDGELDFNAFECAKFIENLREKKFKLVINDLTYELPGTAIIEAVENDSVLIYLSENNNNNNTNTAYGTPNEKVNANLEEIGSDSEQSICKGNDDFILQNNIRSFL